MKNSVFGTFAIVISALLPITGRALTLDPFTTPQSAQATGVGISDVNAISLPDALGGYRTFKAEVTGGIAGSRVTLACSAGIATHSQDALATGISQVIWDGDDTTSSINFDGLGGIDLTQDGSTSMVLDIISFDYPSNHSVDLTMQVYDASDPSGDHYSTHTITLNQALTNTPIEFQFASFAAGPFGGASFSNVGAIRFVTTGSSADTDLAFDNFRTNGNCDEVPAAGQSVYDECGVCGGDNTSCAGCDGVPNSGLVFDACGVCGGDSSSCGGCDGVPNSGLVFDACGECGGDGSSCAGCDGVPNSGKVLDQCNICDGDGQSCLPCTETNQEEFLADMDNGAKVMERIIDKMHGRLFKLDPSPKTEQYVKDADPIVHDLQNRNWILSWTLPVVSVVCETTELCVSVSTLPVLDEYRVNDRALLKWGKAATKKIKKVLGGELQRTDVKQLRKLKRQFETNEKLADMIPTSQSVCS